MWQTDGSEQLKINGDELICEKAEGNSYNAMWIDGDGMNEGSFYWKFKFSDSEGGFVGITNDNHFAPGYRIRAACYGGNLSNGGALLVSQFGPFLKSGDVVGMLVVNSDSNIKVYFDLNGRNLGQAFSFDSAILPNARPVVHFSGNGKVTCTRCFDLPSSSDHEEEVFEGIEGKWILDQISVGTSRLEMPRFSPPELSLKLEAKPHTYRAACRVCNSIIYTLLIDDVRGSYTTTIPVTTLMLGPPDAMEMERQIIDLFSSPKQVAIDNGFLVYNSDRLSSKWKRQKSQITGYVGNPFTRFASS